MDEFQLEYADHCINTLSRSYPKSDQLSQWLNKKKFEGSQIVIDILEDENWIIKTGVQYKLQPWALPVIQEHKSYSNYYRLNTIKEKRKEKKEIFDFNVSKWKYYTFWWFFGLAIFGGGYSAYDFIERLSRPISTQSQQTPKEEMESEESQLHTLILDQKNPDPFRNAKNDTSQTNIPVNNSLTKN